MIVLHGGYLLAADSDFPSGIYLWGEGPYEARPEKSLHPRGIPAARIEEAIGGARPKFALVSVTLPAAHGRPVPSTAALRDEADYTPDPFPFRPFTVEAIFFPPQRGIDLLLTLPDLMAVKGFVAGDDLDYWVNAAAFAFQLLLRRRVAPTLANGVPRWRAILSDPPDRQTLEFLSRAMPPISRTVTRLGEGGTLLFPSSSAILEGFLFDLIDATSRDLIREALPAERRKAGSGAEALLASAWGTSNPAEASSPVVTAVPEIVSKISRWSSPLLDGGEERDLRLGIRLVPPSADPAVSDGWSLRFHLEEADDPTRQIPAADIWSLSGSDRQAGGPRSVDLEEVLLRRLGEAAPLCTPIGRSLEERHPEEVAVSAEEVGRFLDHDGPTLTEAGARILLPGDGRVSKVSARLLARENPWKPASTVTRFGLATLVDFDWEIAIGDLRLSAAEFEELSAGKIPLVRVRGEWVVLDRASVDRVRSLLDRRPAGQTTVGDLLRIAGKIDDPTDEEPVVEAITGEGWLRDFLDPERAREEMARFTAPPSFVGTLRPYQARGVAWLRFLLGRGFGACLADDMGLGKTIQFLTTLLAAREAGESIRPSLLVCPTSVAENWKLEAARFAPSLAVSVHHGPTRLGGDEFVGLTKEVDLIVTTYALAHRDRVLFSRISWEYLALDEAQNVKNPATAQARAVRSLKTHRRAALTGTPVENRLSELKAIFDFLNPGLLGSEETFRKEFGVPIERDQSPEAAERLRRVTAPFLLRRLKTDPAIEPDLPEKIETREIVGLTREQATLYRATSKSLLEQVGEAHGATRRARVLVLLLRLKQLCDHPALLLGDHDYNPSRSAKLTRLLEMLEETWAEKRPALLFTQFATMGDILAQSLRKRFDAEVLFLHGGVGRQARSEMVRRFQEDSDPPLFFVLSLKAGGSGLNLTRASHVFHVDRWWNPAVEDQATDRAFRIGQTRHVQVHKFVCCGTLEERIDARIEEKKALAQSIVGAGENWITGLSDTDLKALVRLDRDALELGEEVR